MAGLLFMEGFETFGANGDTGSALQAIITQKWNEISFSTGAKLSDAAYEGQGLCLDSVGGSAAYRLTQTISVTTAELIIGWAWYTGTLSSSYYLYEGFTSQQVIGLYALNTGGFSIYHGGGSHDTATGLVTANTWYYVELKYKVADSPDGYWELYLDGTLADSETGIDTKPAVSVLHTPSVHTFYARNPGTRFDDMYIYDNTGDVQEPYGPVKIRALLPDGDDTTDWTSTGANHYDQVNDIPTDTANYIESDTANDIDLFTFANSVDPDNWPILGVQLNVYAAVTDVGLFTLEGIADSNDTQDVVNEVIIDHLGGQYCFIFEDDPETSNAWTMDQLNDAKFGVGVE